MVKNNFLRNRQAGVAILFAVLLVSIVLTVGLTLLNITLRQLILSSLARESQFAFYAADSARNCARYYDSLLDPSGSPNIRPFGYFSIVNDNLVFNTPSNLSLSCGNSAATATASGPTGDHYTYTFTLTFDNAGKATCADVLVYKYISGSLNGKTRIESHGYNNQQGPSAPCYQAGDRTVERASTMLY